jgi:copper chaperone CopZ
MKTQNNQTIQFRMKGMSCGGCVRTVKNALEGVRGIVDSDVRVGQVTVVIDPNHTSAQEIETALRTSGFVPAIQQEVTQ